MCKTKRKKITVGLGEHSSFQHRKKKRDWVGLLKGSRLNTRGNQSRRCNYNNQLAVGSSADFRTN